MRKHTKLSVQWFYDLLDRGECDIVDFKEQLEDKSMFGKSLKSFAPKYDDLARDVVAYANEDMWYEARWNCDSEDLSFALDNHLGGQLPHIEDWCDSDGNCEAYVKQAFGQYLERKRDQCRNAKLKFFLDGGGLVYVMAVDYEDAHTCPLIEPTERPPFMGVLTEVSEAEAIEAILERNLPFEQDEY